MTNCKDIVLTELEGEPHLARSSNHDIYRKLKKLILGYIKIKWLNERTKIVILLSSALRYVENKLCVHNLKPKIKLEKNSWFNEGNMASHVDKQDNRPLRCNNFLIQIRKYKTQQRLIWKMSGPQRLRLVYWIKYRKRKRKQEN